MKTTSNLSLCFFLFLIFGQLQLFGQTETSLFDNWQEEDKAAIEALVLYPQDIRMAILEATQHPELLIKAESMQRQTSGAFQDLLADLAQEDQELIYDLARYPGLIDRLALAKEVGERDLNTILQDYPKVIHVRAKDAFANFGGLLLAVDQLRQEADQQFFDLLDSYPLAAKVALKELIDLPEVLSLLTENIRMTILVGDLYLQDPSHLQQQMDSLNRVVAEANTKELENWQTSVEGDPEVLAELKSASEEFSGESGYDDSYYDYDDMYYGDRAENYVVEQYFYYNYPYWFGYPSWYYYPRWRPYPLWYESGFYAVSDGHFVVQRLPSFYFTYWYFHRPYHHYYYPHLSRQFVSHTYYGPRPGTSSIAVNVRNWRERNQEMITDTWLQDDRGSIERFQEYGKFEMDLDKYNRKKPEKILSPVEYLERNQNKYPELSRSNQDRSRTLQPARQTTISPRPKTENPAPVSKERERVITPKRTNPPTLERERVRVIPPSQKMEPPKNVPKVNKGVENHRATIERSRANPPKVAPRTAPRVIPKVAPKVVPKTKKTRTKGNG